MTREHFITIVLSILLGYLVIGDFVNKALGLYPRAICVPNEVKP